MDLDFLEIGTSDWETLCQECTDTEKGMSVEAVKTYIDALPNRSNVIKVHAAVTANRTSETIDVYYIPENVIKQLGVCWWVKGCNSIGTYHPYHRGYEKYVTIDKVPLLNIDELLISHNIRGIKYLKIDTEGHDCVIMDGLLDYLLTTPKEYYPRKIMFETNQHGVAPEVDNVINKACKLGYVLMYRGFDTIIEIPN
jgi:hypothetical protein